MLKLNRCSQTTLYIQFGHYLDEGISLFKRDDQETMQNVFHFEYCHEKLRNILITSAQSSGLSAPLLFASYKVNEGMIGTTKVVYPLRPYSDGTVFSSPIQKTGDCQDRTHLTKVVILPLLSLILVKRGEEHRSKK